MRLTNHLFLISQNIHADLNGPKIKYKLHYDMPFRDVKLFVPFLNIHAYFRQGAVARSDARPPGMLMVAGSILTSGVTLNLDLVEN